MSPDATFFIGCVWGLLTLPRILVALANRRLPLVGFGIMGICVLLILSAMWRRPGHYRWTSFADMIIELVAKISI